MLGVDITKAQNQPIVDWLNLEQWQMDISMPS